MDSINIGVGTYIVREDAKADLLKTLGRLAEIGYQGVELLGFFGAAPAALHRMIKSLGLTALGDHVPVMDLLDNPNQILADHLAIGCQRITLACSKDMAETQPFTKLSDAFASAAELCLAQGIDPMYHNHDFDMLGDEPFAKRILDAVPELRFEPDVGWMAVAGKDPVQWLYQYQSRIPVIHLKDVFIGKNGFTFRPTGYGIVNTPALMPVIHACKPQWLMVDHDLAYDRNSYDDLALSYDYVKALLQVSGQVHY